MLFNYEMNERLLAYARNMASILFIGGLGLLVIYRSTTIESIESYKYLILLACGLLMFLWSIYLVIMNVVNLFHDYRKYLRSFLVAEDIKELEEDEKIDYSIEITRKITKKSNSNYLIFYLRLIVIFLICFVSTFLYILGSLSILHQQVKVFNF